jgi:hypothetical protein
MIVKCPCEKCGSDIEFEAENAEQFVNCPHCNGRTELRLPKNDLRKFIPARTVQPWPLIALVLMALAMFVAMSALFLFVGPLYALLLLIFVVLILILKRLNPGPKPPSA